MAGGILGTGVSGLAAAQYGLDTTGHNIAMLIPKVSAANELKQNLRLVMRLEVPF